MKYRLDVTRLREGMMTLNGWAIPKDASNKVSYEVKDERGVSLDIKYVPMQREDVAAIYKLEKSDLGFDIEFPYERGRDYFLILKEISETASGKGTVSEAKIKINEEIIAKRNSVSHRKREKLLALANLETVKVAWDFFKENGFMALYKKSVHKLKGISEDYDYSEWYEKTRLTEADLDAQRREIEELLRSGNENNTPLPLISIVIPAYNTPEKYLRMLYDSLKAQTYSNFEVCIGDGSENDDAVERVTKEYAAGDGRFKYKRLEKNLGISGNTNEALKSAEGDFIALCDHDDELAPEALYEVYKAIRENPKAMLVYTDEDKVDFDGKAFFEPHFKSDYNPDLLTSVNYICHLTVLRRELLEKVGGFRHEFDGAQDYDFFLRCCEEASAEEKKRVEAFYELINAPDNCGNRELRRDSLYISELSEKTGLCENAVRKLLNGDFVSETVIHVRKVCYHWRCHKNSTSFNPESKLYAFEAGKRAIMEHYKRTGVRAEKVEDGVTYGFYHSILEAGNDLVSVIIPNKDHVEDLDKCIRSLILNSSFRRLEFVIVENNSTEERTEEYYKEIENNPGYFLKDTKISEKTDTASKEGAKAGDTSREISDISIKVVRWPREFNYSAINNFGVKHSTGKYLLFLNNDVELIGRDSIKEMLGIMQRPEVGVCGARLLYEDDTIQHGGVVVGFGGIAGGCFIGLHEKENSYMHRAMCVQDYSAVTAACLMTKRDVFMKAGGFYEGLAVAFNDIDYCMSVRSLGKLVVYDPYVTFHHYESKSRGLEDTPEKVERFNGEIAVFADRWGDILESGDPYYNPNLTLRKSNFALRDLSHEKPGEPYRLELDVKKQLQLVEKEKKRREAKE